MDPVNEPLIGQDPNPAPKAEEPSPYTGPERRAQGYLIAEVLPESPAPDRPPRGFVPPR